MDWSKILRRRGVRPRLVHDILSRPRQRVVRLRERSWHLEVSASAFVRLLARHRVRSGVAALLVLVLVAGLLRGVGRANIATLYATSCLGGWANPQLAEGEPDLAPEADPELFTSKNSAALDGVMAQIYCGGFKGDVPLDAAPKKVTLNLSWAVLPGGKLPQLPVVTPAPSGGTVNVDPVATPEQQVEALLDAPAAEEVLLESLPPEPVADPAPVVEPVPEPQLPESARLPFIRAALAQELAPPELAPDPAAEPAPAVELKEAPPTDVAPTDAVAPEQPVPEPTAKDEPPTSKPNELTPDPGPSAPIPTPQLPQDTEPAFLEIAYTLDGEAWTTVAKVTSQSWRGLAVELPLASWEELATVQVALRSLPTVAEQPTVLLDSLYLAVTYSADAANVQEQPDFTRDTVLQLLADGDVNLVRVFSESRQRQQLWVYQAAGEGTWTLVSEEPELDPVAASVLHGGVAAWVTAGGGTISTYQVSGGSYASQTIEPGVPTDLGLPDGLLVRWDGASLQLLNGDGSAAETVAAKDHAVFLEEIRGPASVAATATAPISEAAEADVLPAPPEEPVAEQPIELLPPEEPILIAE